MARNYGFTKSRIELLLLIRSREIQFALKVIW